MKKVILSALAITAFGLGANTQTVVSEDFESGIPSGWTQTTLATDGGWNAGTGSGMSSQDFNIPDHTNMLATNEDACNCDKSADILKTSSIDLSSYSGESLRIRMDVFFYLGTYQGATESLDIQASVGGGAFTTIATIAGDATAWQEAVIIDASDYAGESDVVFAFNYNDGAGWTFGAAIDNFVLEVPNDHDIKLTSVNVPPYSATDVPQTISGVVTNLGGMAESSITVEWTDGTNTNTTTLPGTLNPGESMSFEHPDGVSLASGTSVSIDITADVSNDADMSNNSLSGFNVDGVAFWPTKAVVGEEATGTWCGWCPRGMVGMEYMEEEYGEEWIGIAVHNGDPMTNADYDDWMGDQVSGYPSGLVDREGSIDPASATLEAAFLSAIQKFAYASINLTPLIDENDEVEIRVDVKFAVDMDEDMSLAVMIVEDGLTGAGAQWAQANYYSGGGSGNLSGAGLDWHNEASSVAGVTYNDVARDPLLGVEGDDDIIPSSVSENEEINYVMDKFDWSEDYDKDNSTIVAMIIDDNTGEIINAVESHLKDLVIVEEGGVTYYVIDGDTYQLFAGETLVPTGVVSIPSVEDFTVYPNPANNNVRLISPFINAESDIKIYDMSGRLVMQQSQLGVQSARGGAGVEINVSALNTGLYNVVVVNADNTMKQTISVMH